MPGTNRARTILISEDTPLAANLPIESEAFLPGWRVVKNLDRSTVARNIDGENWNFFYLAGEKVPICAVDVSRHRRAIKILDDSPARQEGFTFDRQVRRQRCVFTNQNGPCSVSAWHLGFPKLRDV